MAKDSCGRLVPRKALVQRVVAIYRYYLARNGHVKMDKEDFKAEIRELKHVYGWGFAARIQIMRIHAGVASKKRLRLRPCRYESPKPEEANVHPQVLVPSVTRTVENMYLLEFQCGMFQDQYDESPAKTEAACGSPVPSSPNS